MPLSDGVLPWLASFFCLSAAGTWAAGRYALSRQLLDQPGERRSHTTPTPRGGGISIVICLLVAALVVAIKVPGTLGLVSLGLGVTAIAAVGWIDDHRPLSPWLRLGVHVAACACFAVALAMGGATPWQVGVGFGLPLILTNVWNFMDGIDGIAASQAVIALLGALVYLDMPHAWLALALIAGCMGFLPFNFPRARIFMGDVGSGALGFAIGGFVAFSMIDAGSPAAGWVLMPLAPFLVDASLTLFRRVLRGERWWTPHVQHAYQAGARRYGHLPVTLGYAVFALVGLAIAILARDVDVIFMSFSLLAWYMSAAVSWLCLQRLESGEGRQGRPGKGDKEVQ